MIQLHHSDGRGFWLNPDLVETLSDADPWTRIDLVSDRAMLVTETPDEVAAIIDAYRVDLSRRATAPAEAPAAPQRDAQVIQLRR
ncbi:flagellar FlbD family protein [Aeromicrobium sp. IC_218]|uniref:flagellar FlbD family protein n=1 Tax=Aeromicrobium sp. IC_218 TaxID=2545468 RepID=UPI001039A16A|nr:flagellar FlbD family protein [Aeromicrobium sp. IC_218]TCI97525.1 hypothetical protein E0W78_12080 [Aeromicrobium sp. IC_218]